MLFDYCTLIKYNVLRCNAHINRELMKKTFAVRLSDIQLIKLKQIAGAEDKSVGAVIRTMITEQINRGKNNVWHTDISRG